MYLDLFFLFIFIYVNKKAFFNLIFQVNFLKDGYFIVSLMTITKLKNGQTNGLCFFPRTILAEELHDFT